MVSRCR